MGATDVDTVAADKFYIIEIYDIFNGQRIPGFDILPG